MAERLLDRVGSIGDLDRSGAEAALPERTAIIDERDERPTHAESDGCEPGQPVEDLFEFGVDQPGGRHRRQPGLVADPSSNELRPRHVVEAHLERRHLV